MLGQQSLPEPVCLGNPHPVKGRDGILDRLRPLLVRRVRKRPDVEVLVHFILEIELGPVQPVGSAQLVGQGEHIRIVAARSRSEKLGRDGPYGEQVYERCPNGLEALVLLVRSSSGSSTSTSTSSGGRRQRRERNECRACRRRPRGIGVLEEALFLLVCSAGRLSGQTGGLSARGRPAVSGAQGSHLVNGSDQGSPARLLALLEGVEAALEVCEGLVGGRSGLFGLLHLQAMAEHAREVEASVCAGSGILALALAAAVLVYLRARGLGIGVEGRRLGVYEQRRVFPQPQTRSSGGWQRRVVEHLEQVCEGRLGEVEPEELGGRSVAVQRQAAVRHCQSHPRLLDSSSPRPAVVLLFFLLVGLSWAFWVLAGPPSAAKVGLGGIEAARHPRTGPAAGQAV